MAGTQQNTPCGEVGSILPASPSSVFDTRYDQPETKVQIPVQPVNQLPDELLACIFGWILGAGLRSTGPSFRSSGEWLRLMNYPVTISHVCLRWYRIVTCSPAFWCRIYVHPELFNNSWYVALLEAYTTRSAQNLLDVHIIDSPCASYPDPSMDLRTNKNFLNFLAFAIPRAKGLVLKSERGLFSEGHPRSTLIACLDKCVPGTLKELTVDVATYDYPLSRAPDMSLDLPRHKFEELWRSTPTLRLTCYYPFAINTSNLNASYGFVELRLQGWHPIIESTLIGILIASPQLRVLEVSIDIIGSLSKGPSIEPIPLKDLEIVKSAIANRPLTHQRQLRILLRLLRPGPKPLSLCISSPNQGFDSAFVCQPEVQAFLGRSNVTQLCIYDLESRSHLVDLLRIASSVRVLAVSALKSLRQDASVIPHLAPLDTLYVIPSFISLPPGSASSPSSDWSTVEWLVHTYRFRVLTFWLQDFKFGSPNGSRPSNDRDQIPENLYNLCPVVNVLARDNSNPAREWC